MSAVSKVSSTAQHQDMIVLPDTRGMSLVDAASAYATNRFRIAYWGRENCPVGPPWLYTNGKGSPLKPAPHPDEPPKILKRLNLSAFAVEPPANFVVLDVDNRPNEGLDAKKTARSIVHQFELPESPVAQTASCGFHLWFRLPADFISKHAGAKNWTSGHKRIGVEGLDVRTRKGLVVAPPSHRVAYKDKCAGDYKWLRFFELPPFAPPKLLKALTPSAVPDAPIGKRKPYEGGRIHPWIAAMLNAQLDEVATRKKGGRNDQLFKSSARIASFVAGGELPDTATRAALFNAAEACGLVKEDKRAVLATIESGFASGMQQPRNCPEGQ